MNKIRNTFGGTNLSLVGKEMKQNEIKITVIWFWWRTESRSEQWFRELFFASKGFFYDKKEILMFHLFK